MTHPLLIRLFPLPRSRSPAPSAASPPQCCPRSPRAPPFQPCPRSPRTPPSQPRQSTQPWNRQALEAPLMPMTLSWRPGLMRGPCRLHLLLHRLPCLLDELSHHLIIQPSQAIPHSEQSLIQTSRYWHTCGSARLKPHRPHQLLKLFWVETSQIKVNFFSPADQFTLG